MDQVRCAGAGGAATFQTLHFLVSAYSETGVDVDINSPLFVFNEVCSSAPVVVTSACECVVTCGCTGACTAFQTSSQFQLYQNFSTHGARDWVRHVVGAELFACRVLVSAHPDRAWLSPLLWWCQEFFQVTQQPCFNFRNPDSTAEFNNCTGSFLVVANHETLVQNYSDKHAYYIMSEVPPVVPRLWSHAWVLTHDRALQVLGLQMTPLCRPWCLDVSQVFQWSEATARFESFQFLPSLGVRAWKFFEAPAGYPPVQTPFLVAANNRQAKKKGFEIDSFVYWSQGLGVSVTQADKPLATCLRS